MKIAIGQVWQETNTLNPNPTTRADFEAMGISRGDEVLERMANTNEPGGFIQTIATWNKPVELTGLVRLPAWPSGLVTAETFDWMMEELAASLQEALPVEAVLFALHGSMSAAQHPDVEGEILELVRQRVGPSVPIVATLDLHANVTKKMVANADALVVYHCSPHVDVFETGVRGAEVMRRILFEDARPTPAFLKIPAVVPPELANTEGGPCMSVDFKRQLQQWEERPEVMAAALTVVQPWLDIPELGSSTLIYTDNQPELATELATELANEWWSRKEEYCGELVSIESAIETALSTPGLVVLSDGADATTSGAPGDSTWLLKALLEHHWENGALVTLVAPELVQAAKAAGQGEPISCSVGGKIDHRFSHPVELTATVQRLFQARFIMSGHIGKNLEMDMGECCVLWEPTSNVSIVVSQVSGPHFAPEFFQSAGFDPFSVDVLIAKSPCGFRAVYCDQAADMISVQAPGCAPSDFWNYEFENIPRPLWPWDRDLQWRA